jgi:hypothetical protein
MRARLLFSFGRKKYFESGLLYLGILFRAYPVPRFCNK